MSHQFSHHGRVQHAKHSSEHCQPKYTEGPARFVVANERPRDSLALLVTDNLITALNDIAEKKRHLGAIRPHLTDVEDTMKDSETSIRQYKEFMNTHINEAELEEKRHCLEEQEDN